MPPRKRDRKLPDRTRAWVFTCYDAGYSPVVHFDQQDWIQYLAGQWEICPETGRRHFQGYLYGRSPRNLAGVSKTFGDANPHLEQRGGTHEEARRYVKKEESRAPDEDPVELGDPPRQGARSDIESARETLDKEGIVAVSREHFSTFVRYYKGFERYLYLNAKPRDPNQEPENYYFYGPPRSGKSRRAYQIAADRHTAVFPAPLSSREPWFDGFTPGHHGLILLDDYKSCWAATFFLRFLDRYPIQVPVKGGFVQLPNVIIVVTSNYPLESQYPDYASHLEDGQEAFRRRFKVIEEFKILKPNDDTPPAKKQKP